MDWSADAVKTIFAALHESGGQVMFSNDGGKTWNKLFKDAEFDKSDGLVSSTSIRGFIRKRGKASNARRMPARLGQKLRTAWRLAASSALTKAKPTGSRTKACWSVPPKWQPGAFRGMQLRRRALQ